MDSSKAEYEGANRTQPLPSCAVSSSELVRLFQILQRKNDELFEAATKGTEPLPGKTIEETNETIRQTLRVAIMATGRRGEQFVTYDASGLREDALPESLVMLGLDSSLGLQLIGNGQSPSNRCEIHFDFDKPPLFDLSNPSGEPTRNSSRFAVVGSNRTWVAGVFDEVTAWINGKKLRRAWLHRRYTYDALLLFIGAPMAIWGSWRLHGIWVKGTALEASGVGVLLVIWIFLGLLYVFRILFGFARWLWPYVELKRDGKGGETGLRAALVALALGMLGSFLYDVLRVVILAGASAGSLPR